MRDKVFIDTNIIIYSLLQDDDSYNKNRISKSLFSSNTFTFCISTQVINESYSVLQKNGISDKDIQAMLNKFMSATDVALITTETIHLAWEIKNNYKYSIYDSLIVASALETKCSLLYSEDLQNNQIIDGSLKIINPFI